MRGIDIGHGDRGQAVVFAGTERNAALRAGNGLARKGHARDPGAVAAVAGDAPAVCAQRHVQIIGRRIAHRRGRDAQLRACRAGNERGHAAQRIRRAGGQALRPIVAGQIDRAGDAERQARLPAHGLAHLRRIRQGDGRGARSGRRVRAGRGRNGRLHGLKLPIAVDALLRQGKHRQRQKQQKRQHADDRFHKKTPPPDRQKTGYPIYNMRRKKMQGVRSRKSGFDPPERAIFKINRKWG